MARQLEELAGGGVVVNNQPWDPELEQDFIDYREVRSDFRQFVKPYPVNSYVVNIPRKWHAGIAVQVAEGSEIPKARDVYDAIQVTLRANGTGIRMTDEEQEMMSFDNNYFQTEATEAMERMLKKENDDIATVLLAGAGYNLITSSNTTLKFEDILTAKTEMLENPYGMNPDTILMSHRSYSDLVRDPEFKTYSQSGLTGVVQTGDVGTMVDGMTIRIIPEVGDNVYLIDTSQNPILLVEKGGIHVESYRLPATREDVLDLVQYQKPVCVKPDAITKIEITRNDALKQRVFPAGWDPLDGYPARPSAGGSGSSP